MSTNPKALSSFILEIIVEKNYWNLKIILFKSSLDV